MNDLLAIIPYRPGIDVNSGLLLYGTKTSTLAYAAPILFQVRDINKTFYLFLIAITS